MLTVAALENVLGQFPEALFFLSRILYKVEKALTFNLRTYLVSCSLYDNKVKLEAQCSDTFNTSFKE